MQRPGSLAFSSRKRSSAVRAELDLAESVAGSTRDAVDDLESRPHHSGVDSDAVRAGARVPGAPEVVAIADGEGAVPGPHELLSRLRLPLAGMQRQAAADEGITGSTRTGADDSHCHSVPDLTGVK